VAPVLPQIRQRVRVALVAVAVTLTASACGSKAEPAPGSGGLYVAPYVLDLDVDSATLCWVTGVPTASTVKLTGPHRVRQFGDRSYRRFHKVQLTGLEPGVGYRYSVADIHQAVLTTPKDDPYFRFAAFAHIGGTESPREYPIEALPGALHDLGAEFGLCCGDITYYTSAPDMAEAFHGTLQDFIKTRPVYVAPGNHDGGFPQQRGFDYTALRTLFPHDYGSADEGAYYTFTRAHVRFIGLSYSPDRKGGFGRQLEWLQTVLAANESEFLVVFFGGANPPQVGYDEDALFAMLAEHEVDAVFCHDGSGVYQTVTQGIPRFHIGTSGTGIRQFHLIDVSPYELRIRLADAARKMKSDLWSIPTKRTKSVVRKVEGGERIDRPTCARLHYRGVSTPRSEFDGIRVKIDWPYDRLGVLQILWTPESGPDLERKGDGAYYRCRLIRIRTPGTYEVLVSLPRVEPLTGQPYTVKDIVLRIDKDPKEPNSEPVEIQNLVQELSLVRNG
jgi:hypothetical protein